MTRILFEREWEVAISEVADPYLNQKVSEGNLPKITIELVFISFLKLLQD